MTAPKPHENTGNARTMFNPKNLGDAERMKPT